MIFLAGAVMIFSALYIRLSLREFLASRAARRDTIAGLQRAVRLSPENAEYHNQLGMTMFFSGGDWSAAQTHFQTATSLSPHDSRYWLDLSRVYNAAGKAGDASLAADRAVAAGGSYGWVLWEAGLLCLVQDEHEKALRHFRRALEVDAIPAECVVEVCWRATRDVSFMLDLLPAKPAPYKAFLDVLIGEGRVRDADLAWSRLLSVGRNFPSDV
jgi:tetratricopeptide (TPR) repeat protein